MDYAANPETGPVDAPSSVESVVAEMLGEGGGESPADNLEEVTQELVNEAEGEAGDSVEEPGTEDDATEPAEEEPQPEDEAPEEPTDEPKYTVKVNGEEREVPLTELLNGYSRNEDYKAKTTAVAEERRALEAQRASLEPTLQAQYASQLEEQANRFALMDPVLTEARNINWEALKQQDPAAYVQAQDAVQERLNAIQQVTAEVERIRTQSQQQQQEQLERERAERFDKAADEIVKVRPELADEAKFREFAGETVNFLKEVGFSGEEIVDALDHRVLTLADQARRWRQHEAAQKSLPERKVVPKSAVKPLTSDGSGSSQRKARVPANASRETLGNWAVNEILNSE